MFVELFVLIIVLITYVFYKVSTNHARYFEERNLKYNGVAKSLKSFISLFCGKFNAFEIAQNLYNSFPDDPIFGVFDFSVRTYVIRNPEVFKQLAIKDFGYFEDRRTPFDEKVDELIGNSLFALRGEKWRQMRATLSPAYTGSKMRQMFELVSECADDVVKQYSKQAEKGEKINIEMKDFFSRYANDVIATCAFGIKVNSFSEPNNEFFVNGKKILNGGDTMKFLLITLLPKVAKFFNIGLLNRSASKSFKSTILDTMDIREKTRYDRPDMINMLMQVRTGKARDSKTEEKSNEIVDGFATVKESNVEKAAVMRKWSDNELAAQCFVFFSAGYDTISHFLTGAAYELMINSGVQQKLYEEIAEVNDQLNGKRITYEVLQKMKYLDQVISEALRKYPGQFENIRECVKDYIYNDGEKKFTIEKGSQLLFTVYGIHHDPKYYPHPEKFQPERFSDENRHNIRPEIYAPFGIGPRSCIASRFALMEVKVILYYLLLNFSFEPNKHTQIPFKIEKGFSFEVQMELKPRIK